MAANGKRRPPRPKIEIAATAATPQESAAIAAAIDQFLAETAPAPRQRGEPNPWQRAGLIEGVEAKRRALPVDPGSGYPVGREPSVD